MHLIFVYEVQIMNEKNLKKRLEFQQKMISRQSTKIKSLESQIDKLQNELKERDEVINSVTPLRKELTKNVNEIKEYNKQYEKLIQELKTMKNIMNQEVFKKRWWLIKFLLK